MPQRIAHAADVLAFEHHVKRVHHELALAGVNLRDDAAALAGFVTGGFTIFGALVHDHLTIGRDRGGTARGVGRFADIREGHGNAIGQFANVGKDRAHAAAAFMGETFDIMNGARHMSVIMVLDQVAAANKVTLRSPRSDEANTSVAVFGRARFRPAAARPSIIAP